MAKTNKAMRAASGLLVLTLLSTCMISGTYAKYTTSKPGTDNAHVAAFGVEIDAQGTTFADKYDTDDSSAKGTIAQSVIAADGKTIAPGTKGDMAAMTLTGTPEVAVHVSYVGDFKMDGEWDNYCPLNITIKNGTTGNPVKINGAEYTTTAAFVQAVNEAIGKCSANYAPGTDLAGVSNDSLQVSWEWPFEGNDAKDTVLGNKSNAPTVTLNVTTTFTQID